MATLKEIAARANVHLTTVASIVNHSRGNSRCSEKTREKVLRIAKEMGYLRNQLASRLRTRRTNTVCLIAGDIRNPFFAALATAIEEELECRGYQLLLPCRGLDEHRSNADLMRAVFEQPVDGFIVWSESTEKTIHELSEHFPKPIVTVGARVARFPGVRLDIGRGLKMAVDYLITHRHRHLVYYAPEEARLKGMPQPRPGIFRKMALEAGLPEPQLIYYPGQSWDIAAAQEYAKGVKLNANATALVGFNDVAILGWHAARRARSLETVSFDGTDWLRLCRDTVPCVRIPARDLARAAVALIFACMTGEGKARSTVVSPEFVQH